MCEGGETLGGRFPRGDQLLEGDAAEAVARLREQDGKDLTIMGSGELVRALMPDGLIDVYTLMIHPLVLGSGPWRDRAPDRGVGGVSYERVGTWLTQ